MTGPLILITLGILFLLNNIDPERFEFGRMWPVILIVIGLVKIFEYFGGSERPRRTGPGRHYRSVAGRGRHASGPETSESARTGDGESEEG